MKDRAEELEARMAWYEKQLAELDLVVRELFDEVTRLKRAVDGLQDAATLEVGPSDDKPPHY